MKNEGLLKRVGDLGFPLFGVEEDKNANLTLADMVKSKDMRLWEGFPVVLANSAEKGLFNPERVNGYLKHPLDRSYFTSLLVLSLALYKSLGLKFSWAADLYQALGKDRKKEWRGFLAGLKKNTEFKVAGKVMSAPRLKSVFNNYFSQSQARMDELLTTRDELNLEYSLSQFFSPKQKELFLKKLKREKLSKTEKEYFSRTVKKKALALANPQLQRLAQRLVE